MPSIINSDDGVVSGTSGLKTTGGNDGLLNIQSNGSTVVAVTGSGISVTGTVSQTGVSTFAAGTVSAPSITFTGDTNTGIYSPGADITAFTQGGTERGRFNAAGYFKASDNGTYISSSGSYHEINQSLSNQNTFLVRNLNASVTAGMFEVWANRNTTNNTFYTISYYNEAATTYRFRVADSGAIATAGSITLGSVTAATSGIGVQFPATQSASSDANTLDDYEEGTWTPTISRDGGAVNPTYTSQVGYYVKIGRVVYVWGSVAWSAIGATSSSSNTIGGLPFSAGTSQSNGWANFGGSSGVATNPVLAGLFYNQVLYLRKAANILAVSNIDEAFSTSGSFQFNGMYNIL